MIYNIPTYFEVHVVREIANDNLTTIAYRLDSTEFGRGYFYQVIYLEWAFAIFSYGIPIWILVVFNMAIYFMVSLFQYNKLSTNVTF